MSIIFAEARTPIPDPPAVEDHRQFWLEALDGSVQVRAEGMLRLAPEVLGLVEPPVTVIETQTPGVAGSVIEEVRFEARPVTLTGRIEGRTQDDVRRMLRQLRAVLKPGRLVTRDGACLLVCRSDWGIRQMTVTYTGGLEDDDPESIVELYRFALRLRAVDPFAYDRTVRTIGFGTRSSSVAMTSTNPAGKTRGLVSSSVLGENMRVQVVSEVPVPATLRIHGPFDPGVRVTASTGLDVTLLSGLDADEEMVIETTRRAKSIRVNGQKAAGRIARGGRFGAPLLPGENVFNVTGTGASTTSRIAISWRGGWESLWA